MNAKVYKWCVVPQCANTSKTCPEKLFIYVPHSKKIRHHWLHLARRDPNAYDLKSPIYFCEDHFDLPNDMDNYMEYHLMGYVSKVRMKPGCVPTKFECQPDRQQRADAAEFVIKIERQIKIEKDLEENSMSTQHSAFGSTSSRISDQQEEIVVKTENADELLFETEESYPEVRVQGVADLRYHDKEVQTKPDVDHRGVQANPIRFRSKAVQYNTDTPPKITILKLVKKETEKIMLSVYEYLCEELEVLRLMSAEQVLAALSQVSRRAALATGVSERAMQSALDKHKRKKKRRHKMRARTHSHSTDSTNDEQPPLVREAPTDSTSLRVSVQTGTELPDVEMDSTTTNGSRQQQMDCNRGNPMEEGTLLKVISIKEEVHSHGESTDEAIAEEPVIYVKVEPLIDDVDM